MKLKGKLNYLIHQSLSLLTPYPQKTVEDNQDVFSNIVTRTFKSGIST